MTDQEKLEFLNSAMSKLFKKTLENGINPDSSLLDLGLDSLDIVELQMYYDEVTGEDSAIDSKIETIRDLMNLMK